MGRYNGVNHLAMVTGDMDSTIRFWRDLLGMDLVAGLGRPGYRHYFFKISRNDLIAFFEWPGVRPIDEKDHGLVQGGQVAFDHLSIGVEEQKDLWEIKDLLEAAGFWASEVIDHGFIHSLYSFDPNNIAIEFSWNVEGVDLRAHPANLDKAPSAVAAEGSAPQKGAWPPVTRPTKPEDRVVYPGEGREFREKKA